MKKIISALFLAMLILPASGFAGIIFDNLNLNPDNKMLYSVTQKVPGIKPYSVLFSYTLHDEASAIVR